MMVIIACYWHLDNSLHGPFISVGGYIGKGSVILYVPMNSGSLFFQASSAFVWATSFTGAKKL